MESSFELMCDSNERERIRHMLAGERELWEKDVQYVAGVDEAGRGPLAGPVVAAAVIFPKDINIPEINDSKKLCLKKRECLYQIIHEQAVAIAAGIISEQEIDQLNILQASMKAMRIAVESLIIQPEYVFVDGRFTMDIEIPQKAIIKGDQRCYSIAAASVIAKVTRDRIMMKYDTVYPNYGFAKHKGYCTREHINAIRKYGYSNIHRKSFHVKALI
jgi:ribonuclease HII